MHQIVQGLPDLPELPHDPAQIDEAIQQRKERTPLELFELPVNIFEELSKSKCLRLKKQAKEQLQSQLPPELQQLLQHLAISLFFDELWLWVRDDWLRRKRSKHAVQKNLLLTLVSFAMAQQLFQQLLYLPPNKFVATWQTLQSPEVPPNIKLELLWHLYHHQERPPNFVQAWLEL